MKQAASKPSALRPAYFIGWDVGGWNCDKNTKSRDAIVILDGALAPVGTPWRGNLRDTITTSKKTSDWLRALFAKCQAQYPDIPPIVTMAIDAPLGFSDEFINLITRMRSVEPDLISGRNHYLFRKTERHLFGLGLKPLSPIKDMIGSQATKGIQVLAKFASKTESCGVWSDGDSFHVIETYPTAVSDTRPVKSFVAKKLSLGHKDKDDARICAFIAYLFANERHSLTGPIEDVSEKEGWIWFPKRNA